MNINQAISADELGIRTARIGDVVLRSAYQLIFVRDADALAAVAAEGFLRPVREGVTLSPQAYFDSLDEAERPVVSGLGVGLHLANLAHIGVEGLHSIVSLRNEDMELSSRKLASIAQECDIELRDMTCLLRGLEREDEDALLGHMRALRDLGARLGVSSSEHLSLGSIRTVQPDLVAIGGGWFRRICESTSAQSLLFSLVRSLKQEGMQVWIEGIETRRHLAVAFDANADLLSGYLLSRPSLVGSDVKTSIRLSDLMGDEQDFSDITRHGLTLHQN